MKILLFDLLLILFVSVVKGQSVRNEVSQAQMENIYKQVKTPYQYGLVMVPNDNSKKMDSPGIFRKGKMWFMTYIIFDGRGYETWLARNKNLLDWENMGKLFFSTKDK